MVPEIFQKEDALTVARELIRVHGLRASQEADQHIINSENAKDGESAVFWCDVAQAVLLLTPR